MPVSLSQAPAEIHALAGDILERYHDDLQCNGERVRLCILTAVNDDASNEPPVKLHGYPRVGVISVIPYKQRVDKRADAEIVLDEREWGVMPEQRQRALLDHLITHLEFVKDSTTGAVKTDDLGRPKLRLCLCDWHLQGFRSIAQRYGADAFEVTAARQFQERYGDVVSEKEAPLFAGA